MESGPQGSGLYHEHGKEEAKDLTHRNKNSQFTYTYTLAIGVVLLLSPTRAVATNVENHIQEIMAGVNGNSKIQFIVIKQEGGGNLWGPQAGETQSRVMLVFFDAAGRETGKFKFPHDVPLDANTQLIATQDFANLTGAPAPDFIMPPLLSPISGKVCFTNNPLNSNTSPRTDCVSYGSFPAAQTGTDSGGCNGIVIAGAPTAALPIMNTVSLKRTSTSCGSVPNSDFVINTTPTPTNDAGNTLTIPVATQVDQGGNLFNGVGVVLIDRKSTRLNSSHANISYAVFCLKKNKKRLPTHNSSSPSDGSMITRCGPGAATSSQGSTTSTYRSMISASPTSVFACGASHPPSH